VVSDLISYSDYIKSKEWRAVRKRYIASNMPQVCFACSLPRQQGFHIHHKTYKRLGRERLTDLVLLCEPCHAACHKAHKTARRPIALWYATNAFIRSSRKRLGLAPNVYRAEHPRLKRVTVTR
jgi:5-methylcytosine-specific restriction endonuclease McrA